jgi:uncharacterized protein (DUF305 family)
METVNSEQKQGNTSSQAWKIALFIVLWLSLLLNIFTFTRGNFTMDTPSEKRDMMRNEIVSEKEANRNGMHSQMMEEHCKTMPEMPGCKDVENNNSNTMMNHGDMDMSDPMSMSMRDMGAMLEGKSGDELDKAFLEGMIPHHQGAIDMAKYLVNAKHPELQKMWQDIITAQQKEIDQMKHWLTEWGYIETAQK